MPAIVQTIDGSLNLRGDLIISAGGTLAAPAGSFGNTQMSATDPLTVDKVLHQINKHYSQAFGAAVADNGGTSIHIAGAAGTVQSVTVSIRQIPVGDDTRQSARAGKKCCPPDRHDNIGLGEERGGYGS